jgi:hypothetical protein
MFAHPDPEDGAERACDAAKPKYNTEPATRAKSQRVERTGYGGHRNDHGGEKMPTPDLTPYECSTLWIQLFGVIVVAVYTCLTWRQAKALRESNETGRQALAETRKSNEHTEQSNRLIEQTLVMSNRAWLSITLEPLQLAAGGMPGLRFILRNAGRAPATNIVMTNGFGIYGAPLSTMPDISTSGKPQSIAVLSPGAAMPAIPGGIILSIAETDLEDIRAGRAFFYVLARVTYQHGVGGTGETSIACFYGPNEPNWTYASFGNSAT